MRTKFLALMIICTAGQPGCGTQVGNGVHGDVATTTAPSPEDKAYSGAGATDISTFGNGVKLFGSTAIAQAERHIFMQNGSPLFEMQAGVYLAYISSGPAFKIAKLSELVRKVSYSGSDIVVDVSASMNSNTVKIDLGSSDIALSEAITITTASGVTTKTAKFVDGYQTAWDIDATGKVTEIRVTEPTAQAVTKFHAYGSVPVAAPPTAASTIIPSESVLDSASSTAPLSTTIDWKEITGSGVKSFKDGMTGRVWAADNAISYNSIDTANARCAALTKVGDSSWRLPTFDELNLAYDHEIGGRLANSQALDISARFTAYWTSTAGDGSAFKTINLVEPTRSVAIGQHTPPFSLSVLCVR